ncbi:hypothetical protein C8Q78DRAFT_1199021 [Trametes maxima]|nr:hypothetical protein C8Q78DRAFT_1199021 [Trametes maxima]
MTSPYSTPRHPGAPNPTPRSTQKALRPPIYNPYDKFTQPEFDAWIGDITGALKRALGRDELPPPARVQSPVAEEEVVEDSFAEVKARRLAKGKERARDEDFEAEETHQEYEEEEHDDWGEVFDGEEYSSEDSGESEEASHPGRSKEAEVIELLSDDEDAERGVQEDTDEGEEENIEEQDEAIVDYGEDAEGSEASSNDDQESPRSSPAAGPSGVVHSFGHEFTEIHDSDEEREAQQLEEVEEQEMRALPARFQRKPNIVVSTRQPSEEADTPEDNADEEQIEEEENPFPPPSQENGLADIDDPWRGPATYAEDFYAGGEVLDDEVEHSDPHNLPSEEFDNEDELAEDEPAQPADLSDPWDGPRNFAEDFYAGGDLLPTTAEGITPSHLTPEDEGPLFIPGISPAPEETHQDPDGAVSPQTLDVDELYSDAPEGAPEVAEPEAPPVDAVNMSDEEASEDERSPSPPSAILRSHVDWNWPPAFPGRVATSSGHVQSSEREIFEISDDEEDESADNIPLATEKSIQPEAETVVEEQEDLQPLSVDVAGDAGDLYTEFDDIYTMGPEPASFDVQGSYEPISPPGLDFGDLPVPTHRYSGVEFNGDVEELNANEAPPSLESQNVTGFVVDAVLKAANSELEPVDILSDLIAADDEVAPTVPETRGFSVGLEEVPDKEEQGRPRSPDVDSAFVPETAELEVEVFEVDDDEDDIRSSVPPTDEIDISSVRGDVEVSVTEYIVEEVMTEGRLTEEPETAHDEHAEVVPQEGSVDSVASSRQASAARDVAPVETPDIATQDATSGFEAPDAPLVLPTDTPAPAPLGRTLSSTDFPPPISANPNVPDPASLAHTPASPASPDAQPASERSSPAAETRDATSLPANAALHPLFRKLGTITHSPSGLFTPLTAGNSTSVTPEKAPSDDGTDESEVQPITEEVTAPKEEQAPSVEIGDTTPENVAESTKEATELAEKISETALEATESVAEQPAEVSVDVSAEVANPVVETRPEDNLAERTATPPVEKNGHPGDSEVEAHGSIAGEQQPTPESDADADAEGEVDPEYIPLEADTTTGTPATVPETIAVPEVAQPTKADEVVETNGSRPATEAVDATEQSAAKGSIEDGAPASSSGLDAAEAEDEVRPLKRKRRTPPPTRIPRLTRSRTSKSDASSSRVEVKTTKPKKGKGKGKQRAQAGSDEEDNVSVAHSHASESASGGSSAAAAQKMLIPNSRGTSRASSVASNAPSTYSGLSMPSPTIDRVLPSNGHHNPPPPFIHNHGILHHHHGRPPAPVAPVPSRRQPSEPPVRQGVLSQRGSAEPGPSSQPQPARVPAASSTSSPVTRSNCRFHTISIPKSDDGPRILFAVPGCSLVDGELIKDEEIEDQGPVKAEDIPRLIRDVESLSLPHYLISVLRQLVSVDMLREGEVFYIPSPGDGIALGKQKSHRAKPKQRESISARTWSNGGAPRSKESLSMAPPSQASVSTVASSASYAGKPSKRGSIATSTSFSGSELSDIDDDDDDEAPPSKRAKDSHPDIDVQTQPAEQPPPKTTTEEPAPPTPAESESASVASAAVTKALKLKPRRSRRLGVDAAAYKPEADVTDGSEEEEEVDSKKRRKRASKKGVKRPRTEENGEAPAEGSSDKSKRRRVRVSTSNGDKPAEDATEAVS